MTHRNCRRRTELVFFVAGLVAMGLGGRGLAWPAPAACDPQTTSPGVGSTASHAQEREADKDRRMAWWREARFGMFIHWGLYAIPAGQWGDRNDHGEWIRTTAQIPLAEYDKLLAQFNPVKFDADAWARMARDAGMHYIVITSKHHDGFGLFDSQVSDFDVMATPFRRDILKELSEACRRHGLKMCFYHSIMDWHHPDYLPRRDWEKDRSTQGADFDRFVQYLHGQVTELLTHYGPIGVMWFDGEWENTWTHAYGQPLYDLCRRLQPEVIVNNRVDKGRGGMAGMTEDAMYAGDFGTPEQEIPATGLPGVDWETCMTMNDHWGYNRADKAFKSTRQIIHMLCDIASKGGNYLLNIGPTAEGEFPPESVERLAQIGRWMKVNGASIHGTQAGPFASLAWGRCTMKPAGTDTRLYLHVFEWPADGRVVLEAIGNQPRGAHLLADPGRPLKIERHESDLVIHVPPQAPDADCSVVALDIVARPIVFTPPAITAPAAIFVSELPVTISLGSGLKDIPYVVARYTLDGSVPDGSSPKYASPLRLTASTTVKARIFQNGKPVSTVTQAVFEKAAPRAATVAEAAGLTPGLGCEVYKGEWQRLPDFSTLTADATVVSADFSLGPAPRAEREARRYTALLRVPQDEAYDFALTSDDGARLWIDDVLVVDNDGLHGPLEKRGAIALAAGLHRLRVEYFNRTGGAELAVRWAPIGGTHQSLDKSVLLPATPPRAGDGP